MGAKMPMRLLLLSLAGATLAGGGLLGMAHRSGPFQWSTGWMWLGISGMGALCLFASARMLASGMRAGRWPAESVEQARRATRHPLWRGAMLACLLTVLAIAAFAKVHGPELFMLPFLLGLSLTQTSIALRRETDDPLLPPSMDLAADASVRSEHWGGR